MGENTHKSQDRGYRKLFSFSKIFQQFVQGYVDKDWKKQLDFSKSKKIDKSFILPGYEEIESDIIYEVPLINDERSHAILYFLIEHQSRVDFAMSFRVLSYLVQIWIDYHKNCDDNYRRSKEFRLPAVFPIVLYTGDAEWTAAHEVIEIVENGELFSNFVPNVRYHLVNVSRLDSEMLKKIDDTLAGIFLLEKEISTEKFETVLRKSLNVIEKETDEELWRAVVEWILIRLKGKRPSYIPELWENIDLQKQDRKEIISMLETMPEKLVNKGREENSREIALKLLQKGNDITFVAEICNLSEEEVLKIKKKIL